MNQEEMFQLAQQGISSVTGIERTGLKVLELRERYAKSMMPLEGNINHIGIMYAGSLFTLGEFSGGVIHLVTWDVNKYVPIVKEVNIRFRRPAMTDVTLEVTISEEEAARVVRDADEKGKGDFTLDLEIKDAGGEVVSVVSGVWQIRPMPEDMRNTLAS